MPLRDKPDRVVLLGVLALGAVVLLTALAIASYVSADRAIDHTLEVRQEADEWLIAILEAQTSVRGYRITGHPSFLAPYEEALPRERAASERLKALTIDNASQRANVETADVHAQSAMARMQEVVDTIRRGKPEDVVANGEGQRRTSLFRQDVERIRAEEARLLIERRSDAKMRGGLASLGVLVITLGSASSIFLAWSEQKRRANLVASLARASKARLDALSSVASALGAARTRAQVSEAVVEQAMRAAGADTCTLYEPDEPGIGLELLGARGVAPEVLARVQRLSESSVSPPTFESMKTGEPIWVEHASDFAEKLPMVAGIEAEGRRARAFWSMPLFVEGTPIGLLGMGFYEDRTFSDEERTFVATLARQCGEALLRATRLEREDQARRLLETTLRSVGDAVIATDTDGHVIFMNAVAEGLTGWTASETRGRPVDESFRIFSERTREPMESPVEKVLREGKIVGLANHTILRAKNGREIPIDDSAAPIRDEGDRLLGVVMVFRDVTEKKREQAQRDFLAKAGEALVASLDYKETLATVVRLVVPELADWCAIDIVEPGAAASTQVALAHVDPKKIDFARELSARYPPDPEAKTGVPQVIRTGKSELYTHLPAELVEASAVDEEHLRLIRELRLESGMVVPLRAHGRVLGAMSFVYADSGRHYDEQDLAFAEDVARRAAMAIENAQVLRAVDEARVQEGILRDRAEVASQAKDEFLATVSHELRTPLNAILGWTITLRAKKPDPDVDRSLAIVERNARAQAKLIEDVLDVSRIISGKLTLRVRSVDVADTIAASVETVTPAADAKGITIATDVGDAPLTLSADPDRLQQILWNLLANAVKFTPRGGSVAVSAHREGANVCIRVVDTGEGIVPKALPLVFEPFRQADASTTRRHGGLGLGLSIVRRLVAAHGGTVTAKSDGAGKGALFEVLLPARRASSPPDERPASALVAPLDAAPRLDGLRLLVVDDEDDARTLLATLLRDRGAEVRVAGSAREALEELARMRPDVLVSDIGMPEMDGYALIQSLRGKSTSQGGATPALALTAYARREDVERAIAAGFQDHIAKPVEPAELVLMIARLAGRDPDAAT